MTMLLPTWLRIDTLAEAEQRGGPEAIDQAEGPWEVPPDNGTVTAARSVDAVAAPPLAAAVAPGELTSTLAVAVATSRDARERRRGRRRRVVLAVLIPIVLLGGAGAAVLAAAGGSGGKKRVARTSASSAPVASAKAATPGPPPRRREQSRRSSLGSSALGLRTTPTQPTTPPLTPPAASNPAPRS